MHTQNVNVKTAGEETAGRCDQNTSAENGRLNALDNVSEAPKKNGINGLLSLALDTADYSVACEMEACHHYGDPFTRLDHLAVWISGFMSGFRTYLSRKEGSSDAHL